VTSTWTAPPVERTHPARRNDERKALQEWLDFHRDTLLAKCAGLTAEQLKERSVPPSTLSLLGLVRHMTEVERGWFRVHGGNEEIEYLYSSDAAPEADFDDIAGADAEADLAAFRSEIELARAAVAGKDLDEVVPVHGDDPREPCDIRWIYLHMIEEYARHNGHADLLRERIDGVTGD
jgi:uncharacterized damage-inducible protein DinB